MYGNPRKRNYCVCNTRWRLPFWDWIETLDRSVQSKIDAQLARVRVGNIGDTEPVGEGVYEFRIHHGAGYRVYFASKGQKIIILLTGSDKSDQGRVIKKAKEYWQDYRSRQDD